MHTPVGDLTGTQIELEQNNAYEVINKLSCPMDEENMEPGNWYNIKATKSRATKNSLVGYER